MTPSLFACTWLSLAFCILAPLSTGDLEFYRDVLPEIPENTVLKQLARYFEAQNRHDRGLRRAHFSSFLAPPARKKHHLELGGHHKERDILDGLNDEPSLDDLLRKSKLRTWNYHRQRMDDDEANGVPPEDEYPPYYDLNPLTRNLGYPHLKMLYPDEKPVNEETVSFEGTDLGHLRNSPKKTAHFDQGMKEEPVSEFRGKYRKPNTGIPQFTFRFDNNDSLNEKHPFAVGPNDPRYYQDGPFSSDFDDQQEADTKPVEESVQSENVEREQKSSEMEGVRFYRTEETTTVAVTDSEKRVEQHPLAVPVTHSLNNDIYFIAIVAGCSAAAMFALVLISLTWCRLQRGAKAAADIEYPAYGVTGPNKDVSPSGDQRLAQSAQMYHFQHQKQQIIAMENRASATRDPGSVSEAESDEENEEGDYTVYECPGLASTGEMEVKNPLFHDDPTPATPAQTNKEEDHV